MSTEKKKNHKAYKGYGNTDVYLPSSGTRWYQCWEDHHQCQWDEAVQNLTQHLSLLSSEPKFVPAKDKSLFIRYARNTALPSLSKPHLM